MVTSRGFISVANYGTEIFPPPKNVMRNVNVISPLNSQLNKTAVSSSYIFYSVYFTHRF